jgi:hypothetical protein
MLKNPRTPPAVLEFERQRRQDGLEQQLKALAEEDWEGLFYGFRFMDFKLDALQMMERLVPDVPDALYWQLLSDTWTQYYYPARHHREEWLRLFRSSRPGRENLMDEEELALYRALPALVTVYRGAVPLYRRGISWTTDKERAAWFAYYHGHHFYEGPERKAKARVYSVTIERDSVWALLNGRGESEVLLDPDLLTKIEPVRLTVEEMETMA